MADLLHMDRYIVYYITKALLLFTLIIAVLPLTPLAAEEVQIAVASNFSAPARKICDVFERKTGHKVIISYGSTGKLYAQIKNGAPFEIFLSADVETPEKLIEEKLSASHTPYRYATGRLVLWSSSPGYIDSKGIILQKGNFEHLAIANPKLAPYGRAAVEVLRKLGLIEKIKPGLVQGENITQAYQFISSGNAQLGFLALSQLIDNSGEIRRGSYWIVPANLYSPLHQAGILLKAGENNRAAIDFFQFLKSPGAKKIIQKSGYAI